MGTYELADQNPQKGVEAADIQLVDTDDIMNKAKQIREREREDMKRYFSDADSFLSKKLSPEDLEKMKKEHYYQYEYVMVFPMVGQDQGPYDSTHPDDAEQSEMSKYVLKNMLEAEFSLYTFLSIQKDELIVLFTAPRQVIARFADKIGYKLPLDPVEIRNQLSIGNKKHKIKAVKIADEARFSSMRPYQYIHGRFASSLDPNLYGKHQVSTTRQCVFSPLTRCKILYMMLQAPRHQYGCKIQLSLLKEKGDIHAIFPLHRPDLGVHAQIMESIGDVSSMPWDLPVDAIKDYFGERAALFYVFLGHQSRWLVIPSVLSVAFQTTVWSTGPNYSHPSLTFFAVFITAWGIVMLKFYKREENKTALKWGMTDFERNEIDRPEFRGTLIASPENGKPMLYFPEGERRTLRLLSSSAIYSCVLLVIGCVTGIYIIKFVLAESIGTYASTVASALNTVQIQILNVLYYQVATSMNNRENHQTDTQYQDSLITKLFMFQFINSYISFFYIAFVAMFLPRSSGDNENFLGQCGFYNCMEPLSVNLAMIYGSRLTFDNILSVATDLYYYRSSKKAEMSGVDADVFIPPPEHEYMMLPYDTLMDNLELFSDVAVQFGFMMLFVIALPISLFFTLLSNYVRVKLQLWKAMNLKQRPIPDGAQDIGNWMDIFYAICMMAVITNGSIICFTMDVLKTDAEVEPYEAAMPNPPDPYTRAQFSAVGRVWMWFAFTGFVYVLQLILSYIDDADAETQLQVRRMNFITSKVIDLEEDDDYDADDDEVLKLTMEDDDDEEDQGCMQALFGSQSSLGVKLGKKRQQQVRILGIPFDVDEIKKPITKDETYWEVIKTDDSLGDPIMKKEV
jgi:hypothetical protein